MARSGIPFAKKLLINSFLRDAGSIRISSFSSISFTRSAYLEHLNIYVSSVTVFNSLPQSGQHLPSTAWELVTYVSHETQYNPS